MKTFLNVQSTFLLMSRSTIDLYTLHVLEFRRAEATTCALKLEARVQAVFRTVASKSTYH